MCHKFMRGSNEMLQAWRAYMNWKASNTNDLIAMQTQTKCYVSRLIEMD